MYNLLTLTFHNVSRIISISPEHFGIAVCITTYVGY